MAATYFLTFSDGRAQATDIRGSSTDPQHTHWIDLLSFVWGGQAQRPHGGGIGVGGQPISQDVQCVTADSNAAGGIARAMALRTHYPTVVLEAAVDGRRVIKVELSDVVVWSFQTDAIPGKRNVYVFSINATKAETTRFAHEPPATLGPAIIVRPVRPPPPRRGGAMSGGKGASHPRHGR